MTTLKKKDCLAGLRFNKKTANYTEFVTFDECDETEDENENVNTLQLVLNACKEHNKNKNIGYALCYDIKHDSKMIKKWLVVLEKLEGTSTKGIFESHATLTKTDEKRKEILDIKYAKLSGNKFRVKQIISIYNPQIKRGEIIDSFNTYAIEYSVGKIVDESPDKIDYYKSVKVAYYSRNVPREYTGPWIRWHENGKMHEKGNYLNGLEHGEWIVYNKKGNKIIECEYINKVRSGKWKQYYDNGKLSMKGQYLNGYPIGIWTSWHESNGIIHEKGKYINGLREGKWIKDNIITYEVIKYENGIEITREKRDFF